MERKEREEFEERTGSQNWPLSTAALASGEEEHKETANPTSSASSSSAPGERTEWPGIGSQGTDILRTLTTNSQTLPPSSCSSALDTEGRGLELRVDTWSKGLGLFLEIKDIVRLSGVSTKVRQRALSIEHTMPHLRFARFFGVLLHRHCSATVPHNMERERDAVSRPVTRADQAEPNRQFSVQVVPSLRPKGSRGW